jgi:ribosomal protein S18 acetylase RimI-like enzyme
MKAEIEGASTLEVIATMFELKWKNLSEEDLKEVLNIYLEAYQDLYELDKKKVIEREKELYGKDYKFLSLENLKRALENSYNLLVLFMFENKIIGFSFVRFWYGNTAYIEEFHIKREFRRKCFGTAFLKKLEEFLKSKGIKKTIADAHEKSVEFWIKNGYTKTNKRYWEYLRLVKKLS